MLESILQPFREPMRLCTRMQNVPVSFPGLAAYFSSSYLSCPPRKVFEHFDLPWCCLNGTAVFTDSPLPPFGDRRSCWEEIIQSDYKNGYSKARRLQHLEAAIVCFSLFNIKIPVIIAHNSFLTRYVPSWGLPLLSWELGRLLDNRNISLFPNGYKNNYVGCIEEGSARTRDVSVRVTGTERSRTSSYKCILFNFSINVNF